MDRRGLLVLLGVVLTGCGSDDSDDTEEDAAPVEETAFAEQVEEGSVLYAQNCSSCHGQSGEGTEEAPPLVGLEEGALPLEPRPGAVRQTRFETVGDVADFAMENMPPTAPGSLSDEQYLAILAFDLHANGIELEEPLTLELADELTIPR